jgi:DNA polymerase-1
MPVARNAPIQGAGADMTKLAMVEVERRLADRLGGRDGQAVRPHGLVLVIHDELVVEAAEDDAAEVAALVEEGMVAAALQILGEIPAAVDVAIRPRWGPLD